MNEEKFFKKARLYLIRIALVGFGIWLGDTYDLSDRIVSSLTIGQFIKFTGFLLLIGLVVGIVIIVFLYPILKD